MAEYVSAAQPGIVGSKWSPSLPFNTYLWLSTDSIAFINNAPLHIQYYLHLSQHDTESIPLKVMVGCAKWTDCQASRRDVIYCAPIGVFSFQGKSPGNKSKVCLWVWSRKSCENVLWRQWHHNGYFQVSLRVFRCHVLYCKRDLHTTVTHTSVFMINIASSGWLTGLLHANLLQWSNLVLTWNRYTTRGDFIFILRAVDSKRTITITIKLPVIILWEWWSPHHQWHRGTILLESLFSMTIKHWQNPPEPEHVNHHMI